MKTPLNSWLFLCLTLAAMTGFSQSNIVLNCAGDKSVACGTSWTFDTPSMNLTNGCGGTNVIPTIVGTVTNGICPQIITRTWTATNLCGSSTCSQTVTVVNTNPPVLSCAGDKWVACSNAWVFDPPTPNACCGTNVIITALDTLTNGTDCVQDLQTFTRIWQVADCCSNVATCTQTVSVTTPVVILNQPTNTTAQEGSPINWSSTAAGGGLQYQWFHEGTPILDATNPVFNITNVLPSDAGIWNLQIGNPLRITNLTWYLTVVPCLNIQCPESIFMQACSSNPVYYSASATETCFGNPTVTFIPPSGSLFPVGTTPVQCIATDDQGHSNSCFFTVTIVCPNSGCCSNSFWEPLPVATRPVARREHAMAYDDARGNVVLFGGYDANGNLLNDTWVWDGSDWEQMSPVNSPSARFGHEMAYDATRQVVVLYGGSTANGPNGETWEWDGGNWTHRSPSFGSPGPRYRHSMAYDPNTHFVLLYGGEDNGGPQGDTWEWNGSANTWFQVSGNGSGPSARHSAGMATDPLRQRVVLFGGSPQNSETWEWYGSGWSQMGTAGTIPSARYEHAMAFSPGCGNVLLVGGLNDQTGALADTWFWDGSAWSQASGSLPHSRQYLKLSLDSENSAVTLFGGFTDTNAYDSTWQWSCVCADQDVPADTNDFPILPSYIDTNSIQLADVSNRLGTVQELYPEYDTSLATWYTNLLCPQSIGGDIPDDVTNFDETADLADIGISNVTAAEISAAISNWTTALTGIATNQPTSLATAPPVGPPYYPPVHPHCVDPSLQYTFGGRDIIFVHGLKLDHVRDKIVHVPGADATWQTTSQFPANTANPEFYNPDGYFKMLAECNWNLTTNGRPLIINGVPAEGHITRFFADHHLMNRYLFVAYPCTQPLEVAVQAVLTQISDAMHFGVGVVDPSGHNDTSNFGTPSFVIVAHSTGPLVTDVALSAAALHPNLNADYIPRYCKAFISYDGIFSGSDLAAVAMAFSGVISRPNAQWSCPLLNYVLHQLGGTFPCSPVPGDYDWDCSGIISGLDGSILTDLIPQVTQFRWASYQQQAPVRIMTVCGGHASELGPIKHLIMPGFDDGVTTINSQVGNPNLRANWPSAFIPRSFSPHREEYDKGLAKVLDSKHRAKGYFKDQIKENSWAGGVDLAASGAIPNISPSGMRQSVFAGDLASSNVSVFVSGVLVPVSQYGALARYPNHFSFLQSASDHFGGYNGNPAFGGYNPDGPYYTDTSKKIPFTDILIYQERNFEESSVIYDPAVYQNYPMVFSGDDAPLLTKACAPQNETWTRGKYWKLRKKGKKHWIFRRYYDVLPGFRELMGCNYVYGSILCSPLNTCPVCLPPPPDAALWLPFDEGSGSTAHNLAGGSDGVLYNGTAVASGGNGPTRISDYVGGSLCFDGIDDDVEVPSYNALNVARNDFTLDAWVRRGPNGDGARAIVDKRDGAGDGYSLWMIDGHPVFTLCDPNGSANYQDDGVVPPDNLWHFIAVTVQRSSHLGIHFYVDGNLTAVADPTARSGSLNSTAPFRVGRAALGGANPWLGCLDEIEFFRRALSSAEITSLVQAKWLGKCKFNCYVPPFTGLCNSQTSVTNIARICNRSITSQTFNYQFQDCSSGTHLSFSPSSGSAVLAPGACLNIPVIITVSGCCQFCYNLVAQAVESGAVLTSNGQLAYGDFECGRWNGSLAAQVLNGANSAVLPSFHFANVTGAPQTYHYRFGVLDPTGAFDISHVSLNGLPPGTFVTGSFVLAAGASTNIVLSAQFVVPDPLAQYSVLLQTDPSGTGAWQSVSALGLNNVIVPSQNPQLTLTISGTNTILNWNADGACHLQSAGQLNGVSTIWTNVPGVPPITLPLTTINHYFRLACP